MINRAPAKERIPSGFIFRLASKDLRHEWILSLCLVMAVAAVLGPILILLGLKFGSIQILRSRLIEDPRNREIRPMISTRFEQPWFAKIGAREEVAFIIPMTRQISTSVGGCVIKSAGQQCSQEIDLDLLPTGPGDPLLLDNGSTIPDTSGCVLTTRGAEELQAAVGDSLQLSVKRIINGAYEKVQLTLKITGILDARAGTTRSLFVELPVLEAVERYKDGGAVAAYNWPGQTLRAYAQYDGLIIWVAEPLKQLEQVMLKNNSGFSRIEALTPEQLHEKAGFRIDRPGAIYLLSTIRKAAGEESIESIRNRLRGKTFFLMPWVQPIDATFTDNENKEQSVQLVSLGYDQEIAQTLAISPVPAWNSVGRGDGQEDWLTGMFSPAGDSTTTGHVAVQRGENSLQIPLQLTGSTTPGKRLFIPVQLGSVFRLLANRPVAYDPNQRLFLLTRQGYAGFRLYTRTIEQVDTLRKQFEAEGLPVATQADRIRDVQELDRYLTLIFWLIAAAAAAGGIATLAASLYGSVERKRRDIGVLRLVGISRLLLFRFPLYQGIMLCLGGLTVALCFFFGLATLINRLFAAMIRENEYLCMLSWHHIASITLIIMVIAIFSATGAAWRVTRLEPVEALRDE